MDGIMSAGAIGEMGRAVERATQNMSPDQKQEYLRQAALNGIDPRVNNVALLQVMSMQLDRLKQPQAQPLQGGTIRQQLEQATVMRDRQEQEAALRAQIAEAMQRREMDNQMAMERGLGGLDSGAMERAQYAGGGVVALAGGGVPPTTYNLGYDPSDPASIIQYLDKQRAGGLGAFANKDIQERQALRRQLGIGEGGAYDVAAGEEAARLEKRATELPEEMGREDLASFFFNVAAEASKPGATFLGSYAKSAPGYATARKETKKTTVEAVNQARQARLKMLQGRELERQGDFNNATSKFDEGEKMMVEAGMKLYSTKSQMKVAAAQKAPTGVDAIRARALATMEKHAANPDSPEFVNAKRIYDAGTPSISAADIRAKAAGMKLLPADKDKLNLAKKNVDNIRNIYGLINPNHPKILEAEAQYRNLEKQLEDLGYDVTRDDLSNVPSAAPSAVPAAPAGGRYSGFSATPIR